MTDGGDDRNVRVIDRARNALVVKRPQVLNRAAAAPGDDEIAHMIAVGITNRPGDLRRSFRTLNAHRQQHDLAGRPALAEHADDIAHRCAGGRRDHGDPLRKLRQRFFVYAVKQSLFLQLFFELLVSSIQIADTAGDQPRAIELIRAVARIDSDAADRCHAHAARRTKAQRLCAAAKHHAAQAALGILEREVVVSGRIDLIV